MAELSISEQYRAEQDANLRKQRLSIANDLQYDPDRATRVFNVAATTKLPSEVVDSDLDNLETMLKKQQFNYDEYTDEKNGASVFNKFAAEDPYNLAVLERDREHMTAVERTWDEVQMGWDAGKGQVELAKMVNRRLAGDERPSDIPRMKELRSLLDGSANDFGADSHFAKFLVLGAQQLPIMGFIAKESADEALLFAAAGMLYGGATGAGLSTPVGGIGAIPGAAIGASAGMTAGFLTGGLKATYQLERGLAYDDFVQLGLNEHDAKIGATVYGIVAAPLEQLGFRGVTKRLPGFRQVQKDLTAKYITKIFNQPTFKAAAGRMTLQYGEGVATEITTEVLQESAQTAAREILKSRARNAGDNRPEMAPITQEEYFDSMKDIAIKTMYGVGIIASAGPLVNVRRDAIRAKAAKEQQAQWRQLGDAAENSETREKSKPAWKKFVERVQEKGPLTEIRVDSTGWRKYWQGQGIDPEQAALELGIDTEESNATDVDIVIPFATYIDKIAPTEHHGGLIKDLRIREGDMTQRDSEAWFAEQDTHIANIKKALGEEFDTTVQDEISKDTTAMLVSGGRYSQSVAEKMAQLHSLVIMNKAQQAGIDPMKLHKSTLASISSELPASLTQAGEDINMDLDPLIDRVRSGDFPHTRDIYGDSLIDMIRGVGGIQDQGGELSARDLNKVRPGTVSKTGKSIDAIAELAYEGGYISEYDSNVLMEALDRELGGDQVFSRTAKVDQDLEELLGQLQQAQDFFDQEGLDLNNMTNAQVRKYMDGVKTLAQSDSNSLSEWTDLILAMTTASKNLTNDPVNVDTMLARAEAMRPRLAENQNFKDVTFTDRVVLPNGRMGTLTESAQDAYERAVNERNVLKQLADCLNG